VSLTKILCSLPHMPFPETNRKAGAVTIGITHPELANLVLPVFNIFHQLLSVPISEGNREWHVRF
jgi:hypothetical protein